MICVVVLQSCMGYVEGETGYCNETCVMCDVDGAGEFSIEGEEDIDVMEEVNIKVEEAIDIMEEVNIKVEDPLDIEDETREAMAFSSFKTDHEVRLWGVCEVVAAHAFRPFIAQKKKKL